MRNLLLSLMAMSFAVSAAQESVCINGDWQFRYAPGPRQADSIAASGFYDPERPARGFTTVKVPSCWAVQGFEEPVYREFKDAPHSEGFYLRHFRVPRSFAGKRVLLHFGGVWASAEVWLNGRWVGRHDSGFTSFSYDVTGHVSADADNLLAVRVRQVYPGYVCDTYDDWSLGGIYRDVTLEAMPAKRWIDAVRVVTDFDKDYRDADLKMKVMVIDRHKNTLPGNYRSPGQPYVLRFTLLDAGGDTVQTVERRVAAHTSTGRETAVTMRVAEPRQWNAEHPYLYTLRVELVEPDGVSQASVQCIGFREVTTDGGVLRVNGRPVKLRGVNHHDEYPDVGRATTREHWLRDLRLMKAANINYVRTAHYQHAKGFIELCDSIGMYVGGEVSLGGAGGMAVDPGFTAGSMLRTVETVERDVNNPSVIYWSVGNEDALTGMYLRAARVVKALDGTRPILLPWNADGSLPEEIDIRAPHYWTAGEYDSLAATSDRPVITTEYTHAFGTDRFGGLADRWRALTSHPAGAGGAVWMWADQGIKTPTRRDEKRYGGIVKDDPYLRISSNGWDGIVDSYRNTTRDYLELKAVYAPVRPACGSVDIADGADTALIAVRNDYDFTPLGSVRVAWTLCKDGQRLDSATVRADAAPHSLGLVKVPLGRLGAVGRGETAYVLIVFADSLGREIGRNSVELKPASYAEGKPAAAAAAPSVADNGDELSVRAGDMEYVFSRATGMPVSVSKGGTKVMGAMRPTVWHKFNEGDMTIRGRKFAKGVSPDKLVPGKAELTVARDSGCIVLRSVVAYVTNDSNRLEADVRYRIDGSGRMAVEYSIATDFQTNMLPLVGLQAAMSPGTTLERWFGLGPCDTHPNKREAAVMGLWDGRNAYGTKQMRWAEVGNGGLTVRLTAPGHLVRDASSPDVLRFATRVLCRPEKGRLKEPGVRLPSKGTYNGTLCIE